MKIFAAIDLPTPVLDKIREAAAGHSVVCHACRTREDLAAHLDPETEVLLARFALPTPEMAPRLKWVQTFGAGVDHLRSQPWVQTKVLFTTASGIHATGIAELVFALLLFYQRNLDKAQRYRAERKWPNANELFQFFDRPKLPGQVLGVIGFGAIGHEVARLGAAFGMRILAVKRHPDQPPQLRYSGGEGGTQPDSIHGMQELSEVVSKSDYVVIALPLTRETHHCIDRDVLGAMKPAAVLINVGRGAVIDEEALVETLKAGRIAAAALDVYEKEPLPADHVLYTMENVFIAPHVGGAIRNYESDVVDVFVTNLGRYLAGEPLLNQVNWELEY